MASEQASSGPADDSGPWDALAHVLWPMCLRSIVPQQAFPCPRRKDAEPELYQCSFGTNVLLENSLSSPTSLFQLCAQPGQNGKVFLKFFFILFLDY